LLKARLQNLSYTQGFLFAFAIGFVVRLIPELLSFPNPIGWDTIYYAARINDGVVWTHWSNIFSTWLIYGILVSFGNLTRLEPFLLLKIVVPLLYGGTAAGIYYVAWKKLGWSVAKSLLACGFFAFQLAALGISWHFYRNIFGLMLLLFVIPLLRSDLDWKEAALLSVLSVLVVWGHELAAVSLFAMALGLLVMSVFKKEKIPYRLFVAISPALMVFLIGVFRIFPSPVSAETNILWLGDSVFAHPAGLFFLTDYLKVSTPIESYGSYFGLFSDVFSLFLLLYIVLLPLIVVGYFRDRIFGSWMFILLVGAFGCLIVPFSALLLWGRWMLMLVFPFTFFAVNGLWSAAKCGKAFSVSRFLGWLKITKKVGVGLALVSVVVGGLFMTWPLIDGKYGIIGVESTFKYVPSTMQSSSVPLRDTEDTLKAFEWLNMNMNNESSLLVHDVFEFWTLLYLNKDNVAIVFDHDLQSAANLAVDEGFDKAYFVWWNEDIDWYNLRFSGAWTSVFDSGRISVYQIV